MPIYFYGCITMDGYLADSHHRLDWLYESGDVAETDYQDFYNLYNPFHILLIELSLY